jgi:hypothetical protein
MFPLSSWFPEVTTGHIFQIRVITLTGLTLIKLFSQYTLGLFLPASGSSNMFCGNRPGNDGCVPPSGGGLGGEVWEADDPSPSGVFAMGSIELRS